MEMPAALNATALSLVSERNEDGEWGPESRIGVRGIDLDQGDELVVLLVVPGPQVDDIVSGVGVNLVEERL
eukprot:5453618-Pyramimonas_sp.AAC.1